MSRTQISTLDDLRVFAKSIATDGSERLIILLDGPMGSGKTQFTKYLLEELGSRDVVSPSYAIHNSYESARGIVHHFDLFRLKNADDLESTGFWDLFSTETAWIIIEWAEKLNEFAMCQMLPTSWKQLPLKIEVDLSGARSIETSV